MGRRLFGSRIGLAVFASVLTAAAVGGVSYAVAATGGSTSTFYGCSTATGALRSSSIRIDTPPTCRAGESLQTWNAQGPTGPQGAVGQASVVTIDSARDCPQPPTAGASPDSQWLDIPSIPGEATDIAHANQIDVLSWAWGVNNPGCPGGAASGGTVTLNALNVKKGIDKASPLLMLAAAQGTNLGTVTLGVRKAGATFDYLSFQLSNVVISRHSISSGGDRPTESLSINYTKVEFKEIPAAPDGSPGTPVISCVDTTGQVPC
jgi:type VI secretion system secreted protein Hcp